MRPRLAVCWSPVPTTCSCRGRRVLALIDGASARRRRGDDPGRHSSRHSPRRSRACSTPRTSSPATSTSTASRRRTRRWPTARAVEFAGEGVEKLIATDHHVHESYLPATVAVGLSSRVTSTVGEQITTFDHGHFNGCGRSVQSPLRAQWDRVEIYSNANGNVGSVPVTPSAPCLYTATPLVTLAEGDCNPATTGDGDFDIKVVNVALSVPGARARSSRRSRWRADRRSGSSSRSSRRAPRPRGGRLLAQTALGRPLSPRD